MWERVFPCVDCRSDPALAKIPWNQYVPLKTIGILPPGRRSATYLVLGSEPSGAPKIRDRDASVARQRLPNGNRNFNGTRGDLALQFALERWLVDTSAGESYYITDLGKCRVPTGGLAKRTGEHRYTHCVRWLEEELAILRPRAIIAVGRDAFGGTLQQHRAHWPAVFEISHYGAAGVRYWKDYLSDGWEEGLPETEELDRFALGRWPLSLHKREAADEIGAYPPSYRWLLAAYRFELTTVRRLIHDPPLAPNGADPTRIPGPRKMRALYPIVAP